MTQKQITLSSFTNPNGERVHQVFYAGMPITRELDYDRAYSTACNEAKNLRLSSILLWDSDSGESATTGLEG